MADLGGFKVCTEKPLKHMHQIQLMSEQVGDTLLLLLLLFTILLEDAAKVIQRVAKC